MLTSYAINQGLQELKLYVHKIEELYQLADRLEKQAANKNDFEVAGIFNGLGSDTRNCCNLLSGAITMLKDLKYRRYLNIGDGVIGSSGMYGTVKEVYWSEKNQKILHDIKWEDKSYTTGVSREELTRMNTA